jgi:hypothetical protein
MRTGVFIGGATAHLLALIVAYLAVFAWDQVAPMWARRTTVARVSGGVGATADAEAVRGLLMRNARQPLRGWP